jgi:DNA-directed RNA polymerase specialized sigma24 family protein
MQADTMRPRGRSLDDLFLALDAARTERDRTSSRAAEAWRTIDAHVRRVLPREEQADARQDALVAIHGALQSLRATSPASVGSWVRTICRNLEIDGHRRARCSTAVPFEERFGGRAAATTPAIAVEQAQVVIDAFVERVDQHLGTRLRSRSTRRVQAVVALRRLALDESLPEIAARLDLSISPVLLTKWIERGRRVIIETVEGEADRDLADFYEPLARLARERRADAGIPRPSRRKHN